MKLLLGDMLFDIELEMDKGLIGKTLRKDSKDCVELLSKLSINEVQKLHEFIDNG